MGRRTDESLSGEKDTVTRQKQKEGREKIYMEMVCLTEKIPHIFNLGEMR